MAVAGAYARWRFIGIRNSTLTACPSAGNAWKASPLFAVARDAKDTPAVRAAIANLERFCVYEVAEHAVVAGRPLPPPPQAGRSLEEIGPDVAALAASGNDDLPIMTASLLNAQFERQAGMVPIPATVTSSTRLSYLDTQPNGDGVPATPGRSGHGYTLAHIGGEILCGAGQPCPQIATRLAMPRLWFDPSSPNPPAPNPGCSNPLISGPADDWIHGGYLGLLTDLARAITCEVDAWHRSGSARHLVLNLSVGWDRQFGGGEATYRLLPTPVKAVYAALQHAAALDVLVVAAAGNVSGGAPQGTGPVLPAGWEGRPPAPPKGTVLHGPLVYAVGAVQANGRRLGNMRSDALPPRAAFGDHAVALDSPGTCLLAGQASGDYAPPGAPCFLPAMTGTSVSAAIVSAVAAAVWDVRPELTRQGVMNLVTDNGSSLGRHADFPRSADGQLPEARRVTLCAALKAACSGTCGSWSPPPGCEVTADLSFPDSLTAVQAPFQAQQPLDGSLFQPKAAAPPCTATAVFYPPSPFPMNSAQPTNPCPDEDSEGAGMEPYLAPQPALDPCPTCTVGPGGGPYPTTDDAMMTSTSQLQAGAGQQTTSFAVLTTNPTGPVVTGAVEAGNPPPGGWPWTLRLKIRDDWPLPQPASLVGTSQCLTEATLDLEVLGPSHAHKRISYAIGTPLCAGNSIELSGIVIPPGDTVESAWLSCLENSVAVRSQLLIAQR